jgi:hypothetical protein
MKAYTTQLNPYSLTINSLTAFDFRRYPTFSHVDKTIHDDKAGWSVSVHFKSGKIAQVECRGYDVNINGTPFTHGDITKACVLLSDEPTRRTHY